MPEDDIGAGSGDLKERARGTLKERSLRCVDYAAAAWPGRKCRTTDEEASMGRRSLGVALAAGTVLALGQGTAIGSPGDVQCTGAFSGTARDLIVPANTQCIVDGATITHDLIVEQNGALAVENTTIGHDLTAHQAQNIETGFGGGNPGPVTVGHDVRIQGSDAPSGIAYDVCDTSIKHDLQISQTNVQFEIEVGDKGTQLDEFCALSASPP